MEPRPNKKLRKLTELTSQSLFYILISLFTKIFASIEIAMLKLKTKYTEKGKFFWYSIYITS